MSVFISLLEFIIYYEVTMNKTDKNYIVLFLTIFISNYGYSMSIYADNLETLLSGTMISHIGSVFTILFILFTVVKLCRRRFFIQIRLFLIAIAIVILCFIATTKKTDLFFANTKLIHEYGLSILSYDIGPVVACYIGFLGIINISSIAVIINTIRKRKKVSKKTLFFLLFLMTFATLTYLIPLLLKSPLNLLPFSFIILGTAFMFLSIRTNMYDLSSNLMNVFQTRGGYGYIAFDKKKRFVGCDDMANTFFPELKEARIDAYLPESAKELREKIDYLEKRGKWNSYLNQDFPLKVSNKLSLICTIHPIKYRQKRTIGYLFELRDDTKQQDYIKGINLYNQTLSQVVDEKTQKITDIQNSIIKSMAMMVESRDNSTGGHVVRTSDCIKIILPTFKQNQDFTWCTDDFCNRLIKAAPMHDLGKIAVNDAILRKPGRFTPDEYEQMKIHAAKGAVIVEQVLKATTDSRFKQIAINIAHYHHEKWNGEGYPEKLSGTEIPIEARIMALADVFDALVSKRCYKDAVSFDEAFDTIKNDLGKHFDPELGEVFLECRPELEEYYINALQHNE